MKSARTIGAYEHKRSGRVNAKPGMPGTRPIAGGRLSGPRRIARNRREVPAAAVATRRTGAADTARGTGDVRPRLKSHKLPR
jgi:hypothetical protein